MVTSSVMRLKNGQYLVTLPHAIAEAMGLQKGDRIEWKFDRGDLIVRKV